MYLLSLEFLTLTEKNTTTVSDKTSIAKEAKKNLLGWFTYEVTIRRFLRDRTVEWKRFDWDARSLEEVMMTFAEGKENVSVKLKYE